MPTKKEFEKLPTTQLAVMCGKVANDPENYTEIGADKALKLKTEWLSLQTPPASFKDKQERGKKLAKSAQAHG